ncbi:hypothetical protein GH714_021543 [Hevea brasiliensis]|uniref:pectinesterase n=1 Tax=Hevea brasiliensis TaxID=3981 RepID=A0A6A6K8H6_HEVBR|nr:hypothetical protein GH714_021543 [Hevea brasiliensis]
MRLQWYAGAGMEKSIFFLFLLTPVAVSPRMKPLIDPFSPTARNDKCPKITHQTAFQIYPLQYLITVTTINTHQWHHFRIPTHQLRFSFHLHGLSLFSLSVLALFLLLRESEPSSVATGTPPEISQACNSTRFPDVCVSSFADSKQVPQNPTPLQIVQSAISLSAANLQTAQSMVKSILANSTGSLNRTNAGKNCIELLGNSQYRISSTLDALPRGRNKDARAWMGAAMIFQYDCWSAFKYANDTSQTNETMSFLNTLIMISSNALSLLMAYDIHGNQTESWTTPKTERDGFWETPGSGGNLGFNGGFPSNLTADVTVCKDGSGGCYKTVQEAVNAAPDNQANKKFVVYIKAGVYNEIVRIPLEKKNVVFWEMVWAKRSFRGH